MPAIVVLVIATLVIPWSGLSGQDIPPIAPGTRVRITAPSAGADKLIGTVVPSPVDTLMVRPADRMTAVAIPLASVTRLEVRFGQKSHLLLGAAIGFVAGAASLGIGSAVDCNQADSDCAKHQTVTLTALGGLSGGAVGALLGSFIHSDRWERVVLERMRVSLVPADGGRLRIGLMVGF